MADPQLGLIAMQLRSAIVERAAPPPPPPAFPAGLCTPSGVALAAADFGGFASTSDWLASSGVFRSGYSQVDAHFTDDLPTFDADGIHVVTSTVENFGMQIVPCIDGGACATNYPDLWLRAVWSTSADYDSTSGNGNGLTLVFIWGSDENLGIGIDLNGGHARFIYTTDDGGTWSRVDLGAFPRGVGPIDCLLHWQNDGSNVTVTFYTGQSCPPTQMGSPLVVADPMDAQAVDLGLINDVGSGDYTLRFAEIIDGTAHPNPYGVA